MDYGRNLYQDAEDFLIKNFELDKDILNPYLSPENEVGSLNFNEIYEQFLLSAKNKSHGGGAIENVFGTPDDRYNRWTELKSLLCNFNPKEVIDKYPTIYDFFPLLQKDKFKPITTPNKKKILNPENPNQTVYSYCLTILDSAKFLSDFNNPNEFYEKINNDLEKGVKDLQQISGIGPALSRDLLKELGYIEFVKPDIHTISIAKDLEIVSRDASESDVADGLQNLARELNVTPFALDRLLWLIGSGNFFDLEKHDEEQKKKIEKAKDLHDKMKKVRDKFIEYVKEKYS